MALLAAADEYHRPILATLAGAGLRVGEALALNWQDVSLATGTLRVGGAKTDAGSYREVDLPGGLVDALSEWKARTSAATADDPVFVSRSGRRQTVTNVDHRLKGAITAANKQLEEWGLEAITDRVSPHSLRRTYASLRAALRDDPVYIAEQLGHTDPAFTFRVYQKAAKRRERLSGRYLEQYDKALQWAEMGRIGSLGGDEHVPVEGGRAKIRSLEPQ
jgi:integrase